MALKCPKGKNQAGQGPEKWEAIQLDQADQSTHLETADLATDVPEYQSEIDPHFVESKLGSYHPRIAGMKNLFLQDRILISIKIPIIKNGQISPYPGPHHHCTASLHLRRTHPARVAITPIM